MSSPRPRATRSWAASLSNGVRFSSRSSTSRRSVFRKLRQVTIIACGTSWHAGLVGKFLIETLARVPVEVDYGSEYRYRNADRRRERADDRHHAVRRNGRHARVAARSEATRASRSLAICNVVGSMATREADGTVYTHAGPEIGVASTKAFTSQLVALQLLALYMAQVRGTLSSDEMRSSHRRASAVAARHRSGDSASAAMERVAEKVSLAAAISSSSGGASTTRSRSRVRSS